MATITQYPKVWQITDRNVKEILEEDVVVQEKIDGSQISFGVLEDGNLSIRSHHNDISLEVGGMFTKALEAIRRLHGNGCLAKGWTYRGEYLQKPKQNILAYQRVPPSHIILFDVFVTDMNGVTDFLDPGALKIEGDRLLLETVPVLASGKLTLEEIKKLLGRTSVLGGQTIEGVVIKNYARRDPFVYGPLCAKVVRDSFKETRASLQGPAGVSVIDDCIARYKTPARWEKAVIHLKEQGRLTDSVQDIGALIAEVGDDFVAESKVDAMEYLWSKVWNQVRRGISGGFAEWYKKRLEQPVETATPRAPVEEVQSVAEALAPEAEVGGEA